VALPESPPERFGQLDAIRALAALAVFFGHCLGMLSPTPYSHGPVDWYLHSPFRIASAGHQAVIFFFLLSGFVLSLGFYKGRTSAAPFLVNRIFRLYPPYLGALLVVVILRWLVPMNPGPEGQVAVTGFDDIPMARHLATSLTTVRQPIRELGTTAFDVLYSMLNRESLPARDIVLPTELIRRESCGCADPGGTRRYRI